MKHLFRFLLTLAMASSAFLVGFYLGQEKIVSKIPNFQEDKEEKA